MKTKLVQAKETLTLLDFAIDMIKDLETDKPLLLIGDTVLHGRFVQVAGSDLVFDTMHTEKAAGFVASCSFRIVFEHSEYCV